MDADNPANVAQDEQDYAINRDHLPEVAEQMPLFQLQGLFYNRELS